MDVAGRIVRICSSQVDMTSFRSHTSCGKVSHSSQNHSQTVLSEILVPQFSIRVATYIGFTETTHYIYTNRNIHD